MFYKLREKERSKNSTYFLEHPKSVNEVTTKKKRGDGVGAMRHCPVEVFCGVFKNAGRNEFLL